jgi:hypothetical protein
MLILNFSHPLTAEQLARIEELTHQKINDIRHIPAQFDQQQPFTPQIEAIIAACNLTAQEWQSTPLLIIPPALNFIAVALLAELHGLMGYFPDCLRLRPVENARPPRFEVAEILNLQAYREQGRSRRIGE